jgi:hypothetical protein
MDYEAGLSEDGSHIVVRVNKPITRQLAFEFNQAAAKLALEHDLDAYLFDLRGVVNVESPTYNYMIAYEDAPQMAFSRTARIAVLHDPGDTSHQFVETVALNAGYNMKLFTAEQDALAWLGE